MSKTNSRNHDKKRNDSTKKQKGKGKDKRKGSSKLKQQRRVTEIVFDPEARKQYLCGFSERKKQRRAFGLAMQKVKDRKAKIEQRAERRQAVEEQIQEAEERKNQMSVAASAIILNNESDNEDDIPENDIDASVSESQNGNTNISSEDDDSENDKEEDAACGSKVQVYEDVHTKTQWGGDVIVTTTTNFDDDDENHDDDNDDDNDDKGKRKKRKFESNDKAQQYSGRVERFMQKLKGNMPAKKKKENNRLIKHKGKHGAANMQGIGGDGNLKAAKKLLSRSQAKVGGPRGQNKKTKR